MAKYIFVTGGVVSSLGKGIACASIGLLLKSRGLKVTLQKLDPYINVDPGTMSRIYYSVITKERKGDYLGGTVQVVPHITDEIKQSITKLAAQDPKLDVVIVEVGGTVGDIEGLPFLEAIRQLRNEVGHGNAINVHLTLVPYIRAADEMKTKPTQHSVGKLREIGLQADILLCRTEKPFSEGVRNKIAQFCNVVPEAVIQAVDVKDVYEVPLSFSRQQLDETILKMLRLECPQHDMEQWRTQVVNKALNPSKCVRIAVVGKYIQLQDAYKSIYEALRHGGLANSAAVEIVRMDAEQIEKEGAQALFKEVDGILIPGGFGHRGIEGKLSAIRYARESRVPFLGICLGMQCAVIEFARNVCGLMDANSTEFNPKTKNPVISLLEEQQGVTAMGGTMRLGSSRCQLAAGTKAHAAYQSEEIAERHRHRYEFNNAYRAPFEKAGLVISGIYPKGGLVELIEIKGHPWFVAGQFHPEFKSRPLSPHPLFRAFVAACLEKQQSAISNQPVAPLRRPSTRFARSGRPLAAFRATSRVPRLPLGTRS
ncbi:MAG: CTP synthase [Candidatus Omnitrophica bacterium]|nr:CTP synthase [Candidatus Omnitrophota bacterium]